MDEMTLSGTSFTRIPPSNSPRVLYLLSLPSGIRSCVAPSARFARVKQMSDGAHAGLGARADPAVDPHDVSASKVGARRRGETRRRAAACRAQKYDESGLERGEACFGRLGSQIARAHGIGRSALTFGDLPLRA